MALQKTHTVATDQSGNYFMISTMKHSPDSKIATVVLHLFKDVAARAAGKNNMLSSEYVLTGTDYDDQFSITELNKLNQNPVERAYVWLKTQTTPIDFTTRTVDV